MKRISNLIFYSFITLSCSNVKKSNGDLPPSQFVETASETIAQLEIPNYIQSINTSLPSQESISDSKIRIKSKEFTELDLKNIILAYANFSKENQDQLLTEIYSFNKKLAESLLLFRNPLFDTQQDPIHLQETIEIIILHYCINTDAPLPRQEENATIEIIDRLSFYGQSFGMQISQPSNGSSSSTIQLAGRKENCISCEGTYYSKLRKAGISMNKMRYGRADVIPSMTFSFDSNINDYSIENAPILSDLSNLAYFDYNFVKRQSELWNYHFKGWFEDKNTDTQGFVVKKDDYIIVCFKGTNSVTDATMDAWFSKSTAYGGKGKIHTGFETASQSIWPQLINALDKNKKIFITGHSLGAALAILAAYRLALDNYNVASVYTYGTPRVGNLEFQTVYNEKLKHLFISTTPILFRPYLLKF